METYYMIRRLSCILMFSLLIGGCEDPVEYDTCLDTKWLSSKEYEAKLAVRIADNNPSLPGGAPGSQNPADFNSMQISGTIEKIECDGSTDGPVNLGNTYLYKGVNTPAPLDEPESYWIGHVVYVYTFDNDKDHLKINLTIRISMNDGQTYSCNISKTVYGNQIYRVPGELYYYVLTEIYSGNWTKV